MTNVERRPIRRALVSVFDKSGLADLVKALGEHGVEIVSTGKTAELKSTADECAALGAKVLAIAKRPSSEANCDAIVEDDWYREFFPLCDYCVCWSRLVGLLLGRQENH